LWSLKRLFPFSLSLLMGGFDFSAVCGRCQL
jgi:hypothetical protein